MNRGVNGAKNSPRRSSASYHERNTAKRNQSQSRSQTVANFSMPIAHIAAKQLDAKVMIQNILRARGYLMRKSMKVERKWTHNFYYINITQSTQKKNSSDYTLTLLGYRPVDKLIERSCFNQHHSMANVPSTLVLRTIPLSASQTTDFLLLIPVS